jgi:putative PIG3 family NAD(P)H quinone oxidoreductase
MRAVTFDGAGGTEVIRISAVDDPVVNARDVLIAVAASGINRADTAQRRGNYPPPPGVTDIPGLEVAGTVAAVGDGVTDFSIGDRVCALLAGGGYAERVAVPSDLVLHVPVELSLIEAAALPEAIATVYSCLHLAAGMRAGDTVLIHGGAGGIGSMAVQLAKAHGARVLATASGVERLAKVEAIGADVAIDYSAENFASRVRELTNDRGVDIILDIVGASYLEANLRALAVGGRIVVIGQQGGEREAPLDLARLMAKRQSVLGLTLRARPTAEKAEIMRGVRENIWPLIADGRVRAIVDSTYPIERVAEAHDELERNGGHIGKLLLTFPERTNE